ncbi:hypothetical protein [Kribbella kalugense]|uniref:hypothetical protein n=1 Tax=Kribbella kalugense TaxID=2512221 RepID=UPI0014170D97|nr:hypothetical protein [Kribbella kalugense]
MAARALERVARARVLVGRVLAVAAGVLVAVREGLAVLPGLVAVRTVVVGLPAGVRTV